MVPITPERKPGRRKAFTLYLLFHRYRLPYKTEQNMEDIEKTKEQLISELIELRRQVTNLKDSECRYRHLFDHSLLSNKTLLQAILESTADGILAVDNNGNTIMTNKRFVIMWRIPEAIVNTGDDDSMLDFVLDQLVDPASFLNKVKLLYGTMQNDMDTLLFKDGRVFDRYSQPLLEGRTLAGRVWSFSDVTEKHRLEEDRLKAKKLEDLGILAGGIAHDFNNLLQGVYGNISMAKLQVNDPGKVSELLDQAGKALSMSVSLATQLLTFSKGGKPVKKKMDIRQVIENTSRFALSGSKCACRLQLDPNLWWADADEGQIAQVIQNIVLNACEAMPDGGFVNLSAENKKHPQRERQIEITVKDSGTGIPESLRSRIFDPYFTTKQNGSGLGLATSLSIIKKHGGSIDFVSTQDEGSTFFITLPACESEIQEEKPFQSSRSGKKQKRRILLMDDQELVREVAKRMIGVTGNDVELACHGEEAIGMYLRAFRSDDPFDLVILDLTIQCGMGGQETMRKLQEIDPNVIAVVSSGYSDDPVISEYQEYGFTGLLNKPYTIEDLEECLNGIF
jgi:signal transduction histidine kinase/ActR/RegA family two-component response regulator